MRSRFLSLVTPAPAGFETSTVHKRDLLGGLVVLYAATVEDLSLILPGFKKRLQGIIATPAAGLRAEQIGPLLWHLTIPAQDIGQLRRWAESMLHMVHGASVIHDRDAEARSAADRMRLELGAMREDYNRVTTRLQHKLNELLGTQAALTESEARLRNLNEELERRVDHRTAELRALNQELEAFSYSVSHDLRAPLRAIHGFSHLLVEDFSDNMPTEAANHLQRVMAAAERMDQLIDDLLRLAHAAKADIALRSVDLTSLSLRVWAGLQQLTVGREIDFKVAQELSAWADEKLMRIVLENLLGNAVKFSRGKLPAIIEVGKLDSATVPTFFVRDNGAGFDMKRIDKLFGPFQRLHSEREFEGTGIGLATAKRILVRHGGSMWAEGAVGEGATVYFTLPA